MKVYLDNAATTAIDPEVVDAMVPMMKDQFGNPSSTHGFGRQVRSAIEIARKSIAQHLNVAPGEICFTSGGTEADNMAIRCAVFDHGIKHCITSPIEHHAVLHTLEALEKQGHIKLSLVKVDDKGHIDLNHLEELLSSNERSFVSLMHANNEIGTMLPIEKVAEICEAHNALFHSDTVQSMCHYQMDLQKVKVHFLACSAHKFHGPKGVGFLYKNSEVDMKPMIHGGAQERNMRGGTENVYGIVGLAKAFEIAYRDLEEHQEHIQGLKTYMMERLKEMIPGVGFNGETDPERSLYTVLSVCFPPSDKGELLLFNLDIEGIAASGGSACSSGSEIGSHVLRSIGANPQRASVRFSFSRFNTREEIDYTLEKLGVLMPVEA